jgi:OOP family OmpA-OmpF porin
MRRVIRPGLLAAFAATLSLASPAAAQDGLRESNGGGFDLRLFRPAVDSKGLITLNGTDILGAGGFSFGLTLDVGTALGRIGLGNTGLVSQMITGNFSANLGIANLLVVGVQLPIHFVGGPGNTPDATGMGVGSNGIALSEYNPNSANLDFQGLGDIVLHAKLRWLRAEYWPVGLAVVLQAGIPMMGGSRRFVGEPAPWVWPSVAVERRFGRRFRLAANLGLRMPFGTGSTLTPADSVVTQPGNAITYGPSLTAGVGFSFRASSVIDLMVETYGAQYLNGFSNAGRTTPFEAVGGVKIFVDRNSYLTLGAGGGYTSGLAAAGFRGFVGFVFEPSIGDTDGDGFRDDVDRCPLEPEDFDNFEDEEGCPEPDNDRDGILDVDDQCPLVPEDRNGQQDSDGCPDADVQDRDGDQIADNVDQCPDDPEDRDSFQDENGCPDPDNDSDQILDTDDLCPNEPEDRDGFEDDNGCPEPDNDQRRHPRRCGPQRRGPRLPQRARGLQRPRGRGRLPRLRLAHPRGQRDPAPRPDLLRDRQRADHRQREQQPHPRRDGQPAEQQRRPSAGGGRGSHRRARPRRPQPPALPRPRQQRGAGAGRPRRRGHPPRGRRLRRALPGRPALQRRGVGPQPPRAVHHHPHPRRRPHHRLGRLPPRTPVHPRLGGSSQPR